MRHQRDSWTLALSGTRDMAWFCGCLSSMSELKNRVCGDFTAEPLCSLRRTEEPTWRNSCLRLRPRSVLGSFGVVLMSYKVNFHVVRQLCRIQCVYLFCLPAVLIKIPYSALISVWTPLFCSNSAWYPKKFSGLRSVFVFANTEGSLGPTPKN